MLEACAGEAGLHKPVAEDACRPRKASALLSTAEGPGALLRVVDRLRLLVVERFALKISQKWRRKGGT